MGCSNSNDFGKAAVAPSPAKLYGTKSGTSNSSGGTKQRGRQYDRVTMYDSHGCKPLGAAIPAGEEPSHHLEHAFSALSGHTWGELREPLTDARWGFESQPAHELGVPHEKPTSRFLVWGDGISIGT